MASTHNGVTRYDELPSTFVRAFFDKGEALRSPPCRIPHAGNEAFHSREREVAPGIGEGKLLEQSKEPINLWNPRP